MKEYLQFVLKSKEYTSKEKYQIIQKIVSGLDRIQFFLLMKQLLDDTERKGKNERN